MKTVIQMNRSTRCTRAVSSLSGNAGQESLADARLGFLSAVEVTAVLGSPPEKRFCSDLDLQSLIDRLIEHELHRPTEPLPLARLRAAAQEAASLAWTTSFPLLFVPVLFDEKAAEARRWHVRQRAIEAYSRAMLWTVGPAQTATTPNSFVYA